MGNWVFQIKFTSERGPHGWSSWGKKKEKIVYFFSINIRAHLEIVAAGISESGLDELNFLEQHRDLIYRNLSLQKSVG